MPWMSLLVLLAISLLFYAVYLIFKKAFEEVGFNGWEASIIVFSSVIFGWIDIPLFPYHDWIIGVNLGGAVLPVIISLYLMFRNRVFLRSLVGIAVVAYVTYNVTHVVPSQGIVSEFPWWLLPPLAASFYSVAVAVRNKKKAASTAYVSGTMGALIGADFLHLKELLSVPGQGNMAVIGGAAILDMVFLTGIVAVIVDALLYEE